MAGDLKISQMTDGGLVETGDEVPVNRGGMNYKVTFGAAAALETNNAIGDAVIIDDVGGNPALPALDGSQLSNLPPDQINLVMNASSLTLSSIPSALTFASGNPRLVNAFDLTKYSQVRMNMCLGSIAGPSGSKIVVKYIDVWSATPGSWSDIGQTEVSIGLNQTANNFYETAWIDLAALAKDEVYFGIFSQGGNGSSSPIITNVNIQFR